MDGTLLAVLSFCPGIVLKTQKITPHPTSPTNQEGKNTINSVQVHQSNVPSSDQCSSNDRWIHRTACDNLLSLLQRAIAYLCYHQNYRPITYLTFKEQSHHINSSPILPIMTKERSNNSSSNTSGSGSGSSSSSSSSSKNNINPAFREGGHVVKELKALYFSRLLAIERTYNFHKLCGFPELLEAEIEAKPQVLLLGQCTAPSASAAMIVFAVCSTDRSTDYPTECSADYPTDCSADCTSGFQLDLSDCLTIFPDCLTD
jgi:hypothetical protein